MGCAALIALYPIAGAALRECAIGGSLRMAEALGRLVREARAAHRDPVAAVVEHLHGFRLIDGKVLDVDRRTDGGFARAEALIEGVGPDSGSQLRLSTQNEHLLAERDGTVCASVPDLIAVLDRESAQPVMTEELRYGLRVSVIGAPCDPRWRTPAGLELVGPRYFGYEFEYEPVERRAEPV
jgi:hypothetical protein